MSFRAMKWRISMHNDIYVVIYGQVPGLTGLRFGAGFVFYRAEPYQEQPDANNVTA